MFRTKQGVALKDLIESKGEDGAIRVIKDTLESGKMRPEDFSLRELWYATEGLTPVSEAVASSAFPKITGELISSKIISAYDMVKKIGDMLVTTIPSNVQVETIAGMTEVEMPEEVGEGGEYKDSTFTEKYVTAQNIKYGRMCSVTEEAVYFDKLGQILVRAKRIGQKAAIYKEKLIVEGVQDVNSNVYRPSGTPTAFYASGHGNTASAAFGESGLETITKLMHQQTDDSLGTDPIYIDEDNLLVIVPKDLEVEAWQMANSTLTPESAENAANFYKGRFAVVTSPFVTAQSATVWYIGNFNEDFVWTEVWPLQTMIQTPGTDYQFTRDIKARVKCRMYGSIAAVDYRHSYKAT